jgi:hypothetical protein
MSEQSADEGAREALSNQIWDRAAALALVAILAKLDELIAELKNRKKA